jgi:hypothetical protein
MREVRAVNWETFDWNSFYLGFTAAIWLAVGLRELGEYMRRKSK